MPYTNFLVVKTTVVNLLSSGMPIISTLTAVDVSNGPSTMLATTGQFDSSRTTIDVVSLSTSLTSCISLTKSYFCSDSKIHFTVSAFISSTSSVSAAITSAAGYTNCSNVTIMQ